MLADISEANCGELLLVCSPLLLLLPTSLLSGKGGGGYLELAFPRLAVSVVLLVFLKRWLPSTSISTLMLLLGRWRTVLCGTMATVSFSLESLEVLVWLSTSDLGLEIGSMS